MWFGLTRPASFFLFPSHTTTTLPQKISNHKYWIGPTSLFNNNPPLHNHTQSTQKVQSFINPLTVLTLYVCVYSHIQFVKSTFLQLSNFVFEDRSIQFIFKVTKSKYQEFYSFIKQIYTYSQPLIFQFLSKIWYIRETPSNIPDYRAYSDTPSPCLLESYHVQQP